MIIDNELREKVASELEAIAKYLRESEDRFVSGIEIKSFADRESGDKFTQTTVTGIDQKASEFTVSLPIDLLEKAPKEDYPDLSGGVRYREYGDL